MSPTQPTALRVFLVRHAHAVWAMPGVRDFDRPLDDRGREEATRLAATLTVNGFEPDLIFCSNARRCVETLAILFADGSGKSRVEQSDALYAAGYKAYLDVIGSVRDETVQSIMIIGHNPMIEETAHALFEHDATAYEEALGMGFPTAGLLIVDCPMKGDGAINGNARFVALLSPVDA
ncbi:phosphohistidine phosphatase SixA [Hoeflea sp. IMCC20628]|uniref:SixA phosphatase family protein n=1 Tax=Hoeflea sp. IMCC20628 TaxID=1620421 RepID=UPI00063BD4F6|nr:histidine phosphatase family protein [Hoeflea sp. IMCC20628]AKI00280.1 phosphohistidine phosphatase SixA [Hoeflea sp. IMCC20628]